MATKPKLDADLSGNPIDQTDYRSKIGSLMYLTSSRPDIVQAVCFCVRYQSRPTEKHLKEVKRIFQYLRGSVNMGLLYPKGSSFGLTAFSEADHTGFIDSRKSTSRGIQFLGNKLVSRMSKKQNCTAMSLAEAEYVTLSASCAKVMWMRTQLQDYGFNYKKIPLYCDSQSAIAISCNPVQYSHTKHIHTRSYALSWKPCQVDSLNLPDHRNMRRIGKDFFRRITPLFPAMVVQLQLGKGSAMPTDPHHAPTILQTSLSQPQKIHKPRKPKRKDTQVPQFSVPTESVTDEVVYKELDDRLVKAATTASSLKAEQDSGGGPRCHEAMGDTIAQTRFKNASKLSNDSVIVRGNTHQSDKDRLKLNELMELCTNLQTRVIDLEKTKTTQANEINSFKRRVKKLERRNKSRSHKLKRLYKVRLSARVESLDNEESLGQDASKQGKRIDDIGVNEDITLVNVQADAEMFDADKDLGGEEVFVEQEVVADKEKIDEVTLAQAIAELKTLKPKTKGLKEFEFDKVQEMFDKAFKRVDTFEDFRTDLVQGQEKEESAGEELIQKREKKQKVDDNKETIEIKKLMEIIPNEEEVAIDAIPLAVKSLGIVDWKIYKEGKKRYYQIIRADRKSETYMFFSQRLTSFNREDLEDLYKLVKAKYGSTRPVEDLDLFL
uniref:Uncharacterized mitochondrial protein AtMg00810-like n=1 Tax=Tanacetum cinerariifolium TaxID=118510 RepID=A0A6L2NMQ8_TANCI|nr:uncharacterized mitochondrial protein AtMg00810-like [Tanacetum cinerariifolium]